MTEADHHNVPTPLDQQRLHDLPLFEALSDASLAALLAGSRILRMPGQTTLFVQDEPADRFYVLLDGWVKLYRLSEDGAHAIVTIVVAGETFAEAAMFAGASFPVCAETVGPARVLVLPMTTLSRCLAVDPAIALTMLSSLSQRLRHLVETIEHLHIKTAPQRLGTFFLRLCPPQAQTAAIDLPFPKALIAGRVGIRPETLSRALRALRPLGVSTRDRTIHIDDVPRLRAYCDAPS